MRHRIPILLSLGLTLLCFAFQAVGRTEHAFSPDFCEFGVTFASRPTVSEFTVPLPNGETANALRAELVSGGAFQRAEAIRMPEGIDQTMTKEVALASLTEYARHNGLTAPELKWEVTTLGPKASLRATKILEDRGRQIPVTYVTVWHYGAKSALLLSVGGPSSSYPTTAVVRFLNSLRRKESRDGTTSVFNSRPAAAMLPGDMSTYRDEKFPYTAWYPRTWMKVTPTHAATRLKAVSEYGTGDDDFNVVPSYVPELKDTTPREFVDWLKRNPNVMVGLLKKAVGEVKVVECGETTLSNHPAYFVIANVTYSSLGESRPARIMQVATLRNGYSYHLTFRSPPERFDAMLPTFKAIAAGFIVRPSL